MKIPSLQRGSGGLNKIVDFICRKLKLIIELNGYSHNFKHNQDKIRDEKLSKYGYRILRFEEKGSWKRNPPGPLFLRGRKNETSWIFN